MAKIYDKGPGEKVLILGVREGHIYPFDAVDWLDLRIGFFLSVTAGAGDDTITGLSETISDGGGSLDGPDRYFIGLKSPQLTLPTENGVFIGFSNHMLQGRGDSVLASSDLGIGTTNSNYWRPYNGISTQLTTMVIDRTLIRGIASGAFPHLPQNTAGAGGYSDLIGIQLLRDQRGSRIITAKVKKDTYSTDLIYSNAPTQDLVLSSLEGWTTSLITIGPHELSDVPNALFFYWPFHTSRLRIHSVGVLKVR